MEYRCCPICNNEEKMMIRYPKTVCSQCLQTGIWADKEQTIHINFGNKDISGGFFSIVNGVEGNQHLCYVRGKQCTVDEARFGGIIIQCYDNNDVED